LKKKKTSIPLEKQSIDCYITGLQNLLVPGQFKLINSLTLEISLINNNKGLTNPGNIQDLQILLIKKLQGKNRFFLSLIRQLYINMAGKRIGEYILGPDVGIGINLIDIRNRWEEVLFSATIEYYPQKGWPYCCTR
jgi:hypothetical protein